MADLDDMDKATGEIGRPAGNQPAAARREGALERYAVRHGLALEDVHRQMARCLAEGRSLRRFFEVD